MTTLTSLNIGGVDVKSACVSFTIKKKLLNASSFTGKLARTKTDSLHVPTVNDALYVTLTNTIGTYYKFYGYVRSVVPSGVYYTITATDRMTELDNKVVNSKAYTSSTAADAIMEDMCDSTYGPGFTVTKHASSVDSYSLYNITSSSCVAQLRKLMWSRSATTGGEPLVWFMNPLGGSANAITLENEQYVDPGITLSASNGLIGNVTSKSLSSYIINIINTSHAGGKHITSDTDNTSTSTSRSAYGSRTATIYRPELSTNADAIKTENSMLKYYSTTRYQYSFKVQESYLHSVSNRTVINCKYSFTDPVSGVTKSANCIEESLAYPSFFNTITVGGIIPDFTSYVSDTTSSALQTITDSAAINCMMRAHKTSDQTITTTTTTILFDSLDDNIGGNYNAATGIFTAPVSGYYLIMSNVGFVATIGDGIGLYLYQNSNSMVTDTYDNVLGSMDISHLQVSAILDLVSGDTTCVKIKGSNGDSAILHSSSESTTFHIHLLSVG